MIVASFEDTVTQPLNATARAKTLDGQDCATFSATHSREEYASSVLGVGPIVAVPNPRGDTSLHLNL